MRAQALHRPPATGRHVGAEFRHVRGTGLMFCLPRRDNRGRWGSVLDAWVRAACGLYLRRRGRAKRKDGGKKSSENSGNVSHTDPLDWRLELCAKSVICQGRIVFAHAPVVGKSRTSRAFIGRSFWARASHKKLTSDKRSCSGIS
jgi:hypothetical protein